MSMIPWQASVAFRTYFRFFGRTGVTGWTIEVARNGANVANTGWAVAEVDAANNEYLYSLTATAAALATRGIYDITVYETAAPANSWSYQLRVTNDGSWTGDTGTIEWTSSSGQGRITDGATAISGGFLRLLNTDNVTIQQSETDVAGLATLYLEDDTVYNLVASASGYVTERLVSALVVSSQTVISYPSADFSLAAAATSSDDLTFSELIAYARRQTANASSAQATEKIKESINAALQWLASECDWPHLVHEYQICLYAPYTTGTISISSGTATVTGSGTVFPSWAGSALLFVNDIFLAVSSRDSDTQLTLPETYDAASLSGETYSLFYCEYDKPAGLVGIKRFLDADDIFRPVGDVNMVLERVRRDNAAYNGFTYNLSDNKIKIWPCPSTTTVYKYLAKRRPDTLVNDDDVADWDTSLRTVLECAIDWQLARRGPCLAGDSLVTWEVLKNAVENATEGMQQHLDRTFDQGNDYDDHHMFDGDMTDF